MATDKTSQPDADALADQLATAGAEVVTPRSARDLLTKIVQVVLGLGIAVVLLGWVLPWLTHTSWHQIGWELRRLGWGKALLLFGFMMAGLYTYTFTLSASLPGLKHAPALIVNLCGSGVSNSMPGGGAVGVAAQYAIFRSWGFSHRNIGTSLIITSIWNLLVRAILPIVAVLWLFASGTTDLPHLIVLGVGGAVLVAAVMVGLAVAILASDRSAHAIGKVLNRIVRPVLRLLKKNDQVDVEAIALDMRARVIGVVRPGWLALTFGIVGFLGIYFFLFRECMLAFGIDLPWAQAFACYALSRMLTMVPLTPGGIGVTELAAGLMVAFGAGGNQAAAAVVLFAIYSHILEIPLGMLAFVAWRSTRQRFFVGQADGPDDAPEKGLPVFH
ncbi:MAG: flippase-like domain-containing protein [Actinobacteria bacterium]|nr:flippase-like domain-containing protein [Actinomycetota bacterium]